MHAFRDTNKEFYEDLATGNADPKEFERHIYGQFGAKAYARDSLDDDKDRDSDIKRRWEADVKARVKMEQEKEEAEQRARYIRYK